MKFNVMGMPPNRSVTAVYPVLSKHTEFQNRGQARFKDVTVTQVFKFLVLMYDPNSPVAARVENYFERRSICAEAAGFRTNEAGEFSNEAQEVIRMRHPRAELMFHRFLQVYHDLDLQYMQTLFYKIHEELLRDNPTEAAKAMKAYRETQAILVNKDFGPGAGDAVYKLIQSRADVISSLRPEHFRNYHRGTDEEE